MNLPFRNWKTILQEYCHEKNLPHPIYNSFMNNDRLWVGVVSVGSNEAKGDPSTRKVESEQQAAGMLINFFLCHNPENLQEASFPVEMKEATFLNNILDADFVNHMRLICQGKHVVITINPEFRSPLVPITIQLIPMEDPTFIKSFLDSRGVIVKIPQNINLHLQAMMYLSLCMELNCASCAIVDDGVRNTDNVIRAIVGADDD